MPLSLEQQFRLASEGTFKNRIAMSMGGVAFNIMGEDQSAMTDLNYGGQEEAVLRTNLAVQVIQNSFQVADRARWILASAAGPNLTWDEQEHPTAAEFAASIPDVAGYDAFIAAHWSRIAGWRPDDTAEPV